MRDATGQLSKSGELLGVGKIGFQTFAAPHVSHEREQQGSSIETYGGRCAFHRDLIAISCQQRAFALMGLIGRDDPDAFIPLDNVEGRRYIEECAC